MFLKPLCRVVQIYCTEHRGQCPVNINSLYDDCTLNIAAWNSGAIALSIEFISVLNTPLCVICINLKFNDRHVV